MPFGTPRTSGAKMDVLSLSFDPTLLLPAVLVVLFTVYYFFQKKKHEQNTPPLYKGWIPWVGCALEFGVAPLGFIDEKRREVCLHYTLVPF